VGFKRLHSARGRDSAPEDAYARGAVSAEMYAGAATPKSTPHPGFPSGEAATRPVATPKETCQAGPVLREGGISDDAAQGPSEPETHPVRVSRAPDG
jgi:hypothetical protein